MGTRASSARFTFEGVFSLGGGPSLMLNHEMWPSIHALSRTCCAGRVNAHTHTHAHMLSGCLSAFVLP